MCFTCNTSEEAAINWIQPVQLNLWMRGSSSCGSHVSSATFCMSVEFMKIHHTVSEFIWLHKPQVLSGQSYKLYSPLDRQYLVLIKQNLGHNLPNTASLQTFTCNHLAHSVLPLDLQDITLEIISPYDEVPTTAPQPTCSSFAASPLSAHCYKPQPYQTTSK